MQTGTIQSPTDSNRNDKTTPVNVAVFLDSMREFSNGCFFVRHFVPFIELGKRGNGTGFISMPGYFFDEVVQDNDVVVFTRVYNSDPFRHIWRLKAAGMKIVYEFDDDVWNIPKVNPAHNTFQTKKFEVEDMCREADAVIVSTEPLADLVRKIKGFNKPVFVCPNSVSLEMFKPRKKAHDKLRIGWAGGANHYEDLNFLMDIILELDKKYDFDFIIQGLSGSPLEADMYSKAMSIKRGQVNDKASKKHLNTALDVWDKIRQLKSFQHVPFYPPEMYPGILSSCDLDIGLIPITNAKFNASKSCVKYYEYTAVGTTALASDLPPYKNEVQYKARDKKDWIEKLSALIEDEKLREDILKKQQEYVFKERDIKVVGRLWEETYKKIKDL